MEPIKPFQRTISTHRLSYYQAFYVAPTKGVADAPAGGFCSTEPAVGEQQRCASACQDAGYAQRTEGMHVTCISDRS